MSIEILRRATADTDYTIRLSGHHPPCRMSRHPAVIHRSMPISLDTLKPLLEARCFFRSDRLVERSPIVHAHGDKCLAVDPIEDFTNGRERDLLILRAHQFQELLYRLGGMRRQYLHNRRRPRGCAVGITALAFLPRPFRTPDSPLFHVIFPAPLPASNRALTASPNSATYPRFIASIVNKRR
jgi:hypothetical protein